MPVKLLKQRGLLHLFCMICSIKPGNSIVRRLLKHRYLFLGKIIRIGTPSISDTTPSHKRLKPDTGCEILSTADISVVITISPVVVYSLSCAKRLTDTLVRGCQLPRITCRYHFNIFFFGNDAGKLFYRFVLLKLLRK